MASTGQSASIRFASLVLLIGVAVAVALFASVVIGERGEPASAKDGKRLERQREADDTGEFDPQRDYDQSTVSDEFRVIHGEIFFARVDSIQGEFKEQSAEGIDPHRVITYLVTVDRSLRGTAKGQVPIVYRGAYEETANSQGFGPLRIGERYLFFAGGDEAGTEFYVQAGTGAVLITDVQQEEELVRKYEQLIPTAEAEEQKAIAQSTAWAKAREERANVEPRAAISPEQGPAGSTVTVRGEGYSYAVIAIFFADDVAFANVSRADGTFKTDIIIPKDAPPGPLAIVVDDDHGFKTRLTFTVTE